MAGEGAGVREYWIHVTGSAAACTHAVVVRAEGAGDRDIPKGEDEPWICITSGEVDREEHIHREARVEETGGADGHVRQARRFDERIAERGIHDRAGAPDPELLVHGVELEEQIE